MLKAHQIRDPLRAKMADWMLEVFANYNETSNTNTYFKAVTIMDFYFKKSKKYPQKFFSKNKQKNKQP